MLRAFLKLFGKGFAGEAEIFLALLVGLLWVKALCVSNSWVEVNSAIPKSWMSRSERGPQWYDWWLCQTLDIDSNLGCSFPWSSCVASHVADLVAN